MLNNQSYNLSSSPVVHVIDDDEAVLDAVGMLLDSIGQRNTCYSNAQEFLDAYLEPNFDSQNGCIMLDMRMPVISGIECQNRLKKMGCTMPIIFVTGHGDVPTAVEAMKKGAFDYAFLLFPVRMDQVKKVADNDMIMPPKSTWVEPKLRSGLTIYCINE